MSSGALPLHHAAHGPPPRAGEVFAAAAGQLAGLAGLAFGWRPEEFWRATPAELAALVAAMQQRSPSAMPPDRATVERLMEAFPDG